MGRGVIVDDTDRQAGEAHTPGYGHCLMVAALVELGIAKKAEHARPIDPLQPERGCHADRNGHAVSKRSAGDLDPWDERPIGMLSKDGVVLSKRRECLNRDEPFGR